MIHIHGNNNTIIVQQALPKEELIVDNKLSFIKFKFEWKEFLFLCLKLVKWMIKLIIVPLILN